MKYSEPLKLYTTYKMYNYSEKTYAISIVRLPA